MIDDGMPEAISGDGIARTTVKAMRELLATAPDEAQVFLRIAGFMFDTVGAAVACNCSGDPGLILELDVHQSVVVP